MPKERNETEAAEPHTGPENRKGKNGLRGRAMLEEEHVIALNDVILACREAEARYGTLSSIAKDAALIEKFRNAAEAKSRTALCLETAVKEMGSLPKDLDPDRQALKSLWTQLKTALKDDGLSVVFQEGIAIEAETEDRCKRALQHTFPEGITRTLAELQRRSQSFRQWLEERVVS